MTSGPQNKIPFVEALHRRRPVQLEEDGGGLGGCMDNYAGGGGVSNGKGSFHPMSQTMLSHCAA